MPNDKYLQRSGKILTSKALQEKGAKNDHDDDRPCKIRRTSSSFNTSLPDDCLNIIFKRLENKGDRSSFGLTCLQWLRIQNNNHESLWCQNNYDPDNKYEPGKYPKISTESLAIITCRLLVRFQHLKRLSLSRFPRITDFVTSQSFGSEVHSLSLDNCTEYSDIQLSLVFSWFPRLTYIRLDSCGITDKGLEALSKYCSSLKTVLLPSCYLITDLGISFLVQNCRQLRSLNIDSCMNITGIGFLECAHTFTSLEAGGCKLKPEGINAIVSGGGIKYLCLKRLDEFEVDEGFAKVEKKFPEVEEGCISTEAVITISKGCPLLKELFLSHCEEVELEGWEAIGQNCKELESLFLTGCQKLCDAGLQALCDGCNQLSILYVDSRKNSCSNSAVEHFERTKPGVMCLWP